MAWHERDLRGIWNRALDVSGLFPHQRRELRLGPGDDALAAVLRLDGPSGNGGLLHGIELLGQENLDAALAGMHYLGLHDAAAAVSDIADRLHRYEEAGDEGALDDLEREADETYSTVLPDEAIMDALEQRKQTAPVDFAPLTGYWALW